MTLDECRLIARLLRETADLVERGLIAVGTVEIENELLHNYTLDGSAQYVPSGWQEVRITLKGDVRVKTEELYETLWCKRLEVTT